MKIFVDFDDVIFNAKRFKKDLIKVFLKNGISKSEFNNSYYTFQKRAQEFGQYYNPKKQVEVLRRKNKIDGKKLNRDLDDLLVDLRKYVFPDVENFLKKFYKKDLFLITYGHVVFQMKKIKRAGLQKKFNRVLITKDNKIDKIIKFSKEREFSPKEKIILIDDRPEQLEKAKKKSKSIITFRICRPEGRYSDLICMEKDWEVKNLRSVFGVLKREGLIKG